MHHDLRNACTTGPAYAEEKETLLATLDRIISEVSEEDLRHYRDNLPHL